MWGNLEEFVGKFGRLSVLNREKNIELWGLEVRKLYKGKKLEKLLGDLGKRMVGDKGEDNGIRGRNGKE